MIVAIGCGAPDPVPGLIAQLQSPDGEKRLAAVEKLRELGSAAAPAVPALTRQMQDVHPGVRQSAARALGGLGDAARPALPTLERALDDPDLPVQMAAAWGLKALDPDGRKFVPTLTRAMRSGEGGTIVAVGHLGAEATWALPTLTTLLSDRRPGVRRLAAEALGKIGPDAASRAALAKAANDPDDRVREAVAAVLKAQPAASAR
ncbi:MAG: HEAT repeat domain-containing protein [Planctomycetaceae bacterium]